MDRLLLNTLAGVACALSLSSNAWAVNADGSCESNELDAGTCATINSYSVVAITDSAGNFPVINNDGNSVFTYEVAGPGVYGNRTKDVRGLSHFDVLVPTCEPDGLSILSAGPNAEHLDRDPSSGYSADGYTVLKFDKGVGKNSTKQFSYTLQGNVAASLSEVAIKAGTGLHTGAILGPTCELPAIASVKQCFDQQLLEPDVSGESISWFSQAVFNDGETELFDVSLTQNNANMACTIVGVDGNSDNRALQPGQPLQLIPGSLPPGEALELAIECTHSSPNIRDNVTVSAVSGSGQPVSVDVLTSLAEQCPVQTTPSLSLATDCGQFAMVSSSAGLAVEQCPQITITNTGNESLEDIVVMNSEIPALVSGLDVGLLNPGESINVASVIGGDLCFNPMTPDQLPLDGEFGRFDPSYLTFSSTTHVEGFGVSGQQVISTVSKTCDLMDGCNPPLD